MVSGKEKVDSVIPQQSRELGEENFRTILNNMGDPVFVKDDRSRLVLANDAFCQLFGRSRDEIIGKTLAEDVPPEEQEHFMKVDKQVLSDGTESVIEESLTIRGGETKTISTRKTRFIDESGNRFLIGVIRDVTAIKDAEELGRLNKLNELLLSAAQVLSAPNVESTQTLRDLAKLLAVHFGSVCDISVVDNASGLIRPIAIWHTDQEVREVIENLFGSMKVKKGQGLVGSVIEKGEEVCIQKVPESMQMGPSRVHSKIVPVSLMYFPLSGSEGVIGSLNLTRIIGTDLFTEAELNQIRTIGRYISLFVENVLLKEEQENVNRLRRQAEEQMANEKKWAEFKLKVSSVLADVESNLNMILQRLCEIVSEYFDVVADIQFHNLETGKIEMVAFHHYREEVKSALESTITTRELEVGEGMVGSVVKTGKEFFVDQLPEWLKEKSENQGVNPLIIPCSFAYLPLQSLGKILGTLDLTRLSGQAPINPSELIRMRDLAEHAASVIEIRLLQQEQEKEIVRRRRVEQKLARSSVMLERMEAETRAILNAIPIYISRVSKDLRYLFLNDYFKNLGTDPRLLEGRFTVDVVGEEGVKKIKPYYDRVLKGESLSYEYDGVMADGKYHYFSVALAPDRTEEGEVVGFYSCATDITSKVLAEQEAERTQDRFESLSLNSGDAFFFHDEDQNILDVNEVATEMLGYSRAEFLKMKAADIDTRWKKNVYQQYLKQLDVNTPQTFDTMVFKKGGAELPVEVRFVKRVEEGKTYIQSLIRDRTEKREQEERLQRSEQHLRLIFDNVEDFIATIESDGTIESVNKTSQGIKPEDVIGGSVFDWYPDKTIRNSVERGFEELRTSGKGFDVETTDFSGPDGSVRTYFNKYIGIFQEGKLLKAILIIRDITEERNEERAVMNAVLKGQEEERKRLGAELHDGIGQVLSALVLQVSQIHQAVSKEEKDSVQQKITTLKHNLQGAIKEVRNISHDLMPDVLDALGLLQAIKQMCSNLQERSGIQVRFNHIDVEPRYDPAIEVNLFRISQELLNNVQKHAESGSVFVSLMDHGDILSLTIEDDGIGFDRSVVTNGIGLKNVRSRVNMINGEIDVESAKNSGTLVNIEVPKTLI